MFALLRFILFSSLPWNCWMKHFKTSFLLFLFLMQFNSFLTCRGIWYACKEDIIHIYTRTLLALTLRTMSCFLPWDCCNRHNKSSFLRFFLLYTDKFTSVSPGRRYTEKEISYVHKCASSYKINLLKKGI